MHQIIDSFTNLIQVAAKNWLVTLMIFFMTVALGGGAFFFLNFKSFQEGHFPTPAVESARFNRAVIANREIANLLDGDLKRLGADRVLVRQFHNGRMDLSSLPFTSVSTTFVSLKAGVSFPEENYNSVPLSTLNEVLIEVWDNPREPHCAKTIVARLGDGAYKERLEKLGVKAQYVCPITNSKGWPIGVIIAGYIDENDLPTDEEAYATLSKTADQIAGYLLTVTKKSKSPWKF